ncbi:Vesicle-associated membrane protein-associated protein B [Hondaea fermentalgiana]|uniref:Vesicle-associated membrane protein-associated protein B n=1 Tax=Hondaea fermentalgiana TaxID=2315210 RepID=A0A2R5GCG0_9STRA|nr:Vesicle-associated membrane protein-associated protein B [Hondaea fermentalgiana]|eukprot:GBG25841.1 Vesicle-associated membrane protein-associated protein B [Hondaea fermentalgiana]
MGEESLVNVEPRTLQFQVRGEQNASGSRAPDTWPMHERRRTLVIKATDLTHDVNDKARDDVDANAGGDIFVAFKLQTNASKRFSVQPAQGYLRAGEAVRVTILLKPGLGWSDADKFLVRAAKTETDTIPVSQVWDRVKGRVQKIVLRCEFVSAEAASAAQVTSKEDTSPLEVLVPNVGGERRSASRSMDQSNGAPTEQARQESPSARASRPDPVSSQKEPTPKLAGLGDHLGSLVVKNLSMAPEDKLSRAQLEELLRLRDRVGPQAWTVLQDEALAQISHMRGSPKSAFDSEDAAARTSRSRAAGDQEPWASSRAEAQRPTQLSTSPHKQSAPRKSKSSSSNSSAMQEEVAAVLSRAVEHLDARRAHEAIAAFRRGRELAAPHSVQRAQVEVGLGSAYEAAGFLDNAIGCYVDAARLYDALHERACIGQVCGAIAHVYADMRDHAKAAAWFDEQLSLCGTDPEQGSQRATVMMARDHQMKIGHVPPTRLAQAKALVQDILQGGASAPVTQHEDIPLRQQHARRPSPGTSSPHHQQNGTVAIETLWEPSMGPSATAPSSSFVGGGAGGGGASQKFTDSGPAARSQPRIAPSSKPNYLNATRASQAARFDSARDRAPKEPEPPLNGPPPTYVDPVSAREAKERAKAASAQHVRRSLEARRLRDQGRGIRPPMAKRTSSDVDEDTDIVYLDVTTEMDGQTYSVALPGPPGVAESLTVREMRERVSFVTGIELHDFQLVVDDVPLADSWTAGDIGLGSRAEVGLRLLPGVRPQKYVKAFRPPEHHKEQQPAGHDNSVVASPDEPIEANKAATLGSKRTASTDEVVEFSADGAATRDHDPTSDSEGDIVTQPDASNGQDATGDIEDEENRSKGACCDDADDDDNEDDANVDVDVSNDAGGLAREEQKDAMPRSRAPSEAQTLPAPSRRPPPPAYIDDSNNGSKSLVLANGPGSPGANALEDLLQSIEQSIRSRQRADELADELERRALEVLGDDEGNNYLKDADEEGASPAQKTSTASGKKRAPGDDGPDDEATFAAAAEDEDDDEEDAERNDRKVNSGESTQNGVGPARAASAADELAARILDLEKQLAKSEVDRSKLEKLMEVTKGKLADLNTGNAQSSQVKQSLKREVAVLRSDFKTLASETRASLTNFQEVLRRNVRALQTISVQEPPVIIGLLTGGNETVEEGDAFAATEEGMLVPGSAPDGPRFRVQSVVNLGNSSKLHDAKVAMDAMAASFAKGTSAHAFVVSVGAPVALFGRKEDPSFLVEQVRAVFRALENAEFPMRVRAVALAEEAINEIGEVSDLLDPGQGPNHSGTPASVEIHSDASGVNVDVRLRGAVAVKFRTCDDFQRLFNVLLSQFRHRPRTHLIMMLEDEVSARKFTFVQVSGDATSVPQGMAAVLGAAGSPRARTLVFAGLDDTASEKDEGDQANDEDEDDAPNTAKLLAKFFPLMLAE